MRALRIDTTDWTVRDEELRAERRHYGGRLLTSTIVAEEVEPLCHPLGAGNKLVIANGLFAGHASAPCSGRISVGCKSPLTGGIKEANTGGDVGCYLGRHGLRAIVLEGLPGEDAWKLLHLGGEGVRLLPADAYAGLNTYDTVAAIRRDLGEKATVLCIGRAGEQRMNAASIALTSIEGPPSRHAGRGGIGAVMGAKRVKAIVVDPVAGKGTPPADEATFSALCADFAKEVREARKILRDYGTANLVNIINELGGLATRNFTAGSFEHAEEISGEKLRELIDVRGGAHGRPCMPGCPIQCANRFVCADGTVVDDIEFESIVLLGSNLGIGNLDDLAKLERACDDIGLDTIEIGNALGVLMEAGVLEFGDGPGALGLLREVSEGTPLGRIVGAGAAVAAKAYGVRRAPTVKGQGMAAYDPRALKGMGVTYATSPMGADHTAGAAIPKRPGIGELELDTMDKQDKDLLSYDLQILTGALDALGVCMFTGPMVGPVQTWARILSAFTGEEWTFRRLLELADDMIQLELDFNRRAGFTRQHDRLPEHFLTEPLPPKGPVFDVAEGKLDGVTGQLRVEDRVREE
ncbi:MAG: aldehyde ferredoxin oxidoreductase [Armatimonadetes bacterium]|nr:aldehyde ferredoxin oxidoreductase [Armatimonadota bacterium]